MGFTRTRMNYPIYDPSTDGSLGFWVDFSDSTTIQDTTGGSISNGETMGQIVTKAGTARTFSQWGATGRPTWVTDVLNGLAMGRFQTQMLATTTVTGFTSLSGFSYMQVFVRGVNDGNITFCANMTDIATGFRDIGGFQTGGGSFGGFRINSDTFTNIGGNGIGTSPTILAASIDYANAKASLFQKGSRYVNAATYGTAGSTSATEPGAIGYGGIPQISGPAIGVASADTYIGESLAWFSALTPVQLYATHDYLRRKWRVG